MENRVGNRVRILSIDDSKAVHAFINSCLTYPSVQVTHAYSGNEGIKLVHDKPGDFDLILLDWEMPDLNGPDVLIKLIDSGIKTPIVMLTSKNNPNDIIKLLGLGAKEYVMKPFTSDILLEKIEGVLNVKIGGGWVNEAK